MLQTGFGLLVDANKIVAVVEDGCAKKEGGKGSPEASLRHARPCPPPEGSAQTRPQRRACRSGNPPKWSGEILESVPETREFGYRSSLRGMRKKKKGNDRRGRPKETERGKATGILSGRDLTGPPTIIRMPVQPFAKSSENLGRKRGGRGRTVAGRRRKRSCQKLQGFTGRWSPKEGGLRTLRKWYLIR